MDLGEIRDRQSLPWRDQMVTFWMKLEQEQGSRIREKIRITSASLLRCQTGAHA